MKVYTTFILSASITRGVTYVKLTHTVAEGRYTTAPYLFPADVGSKPYYTRRCCRDLKGYFVLQV